MDIKLLIAYINYYSGKESNSCTETQKFVKKYQQPGGGYIQLADVLTDENVNPSEVTFEGDDKKQSRKTYYEFLYELKQRKEPYNLLDELPNKSEWEEVFDNLALKKDDTVWTTPFEKLEKNKEIGQPTQKWHLFISYFGWKLFAGPNAVKRMQWDGVQCPELLIWLAEVIYEKEKGKIISESDLKDFIDNAIEFKKNTKDKDSQEKYKRAREKIRAKIDDFLL